MPQGEWMPKAALDKMEQRIAALEEAAAQAYVKLGETVGRSEIQEVRKCLAQVLERGPKKGD